MALTHLVDTSVYSQPLKPRPVLSVETRWKTLGDEALAISVVCQAEVLYGLHLKQSPRLFSAYEHLLKDRLHQFQVDYEVAARFAMFKAAGKRAGRACSDFDLVIAATGAARGLIVATLNYSHFSWIQGLAVEDWSY